MSKIEVKPYNQANKSKKEEVAEMFLGPQPGNCKYGDGQVPAIMCVSNRRAAFNSKVCIIF